MNLEPDFVNIEDVLEIHQQQLARYGGSAGIRDSGLMESAVLTPQASFGGQFVHATIFEMAAA